MWSTNISNKTRFENYMVARRTFFFYYDEVTDCLTDVILHNTRCSRDCQSSTRVLVLVKQSQRQRPAAHDQCLVF